MSLDPTRTIHVVGDIHAGWTLQSRIDLLTDDLAVTASDCVLRVYIGDLAEVGSNATHVGLAQAFLALTPDPWDAITGNHDYDGADNDDFNLAYGETEQNWIRDLSFCRVIALNPFSIVDAAEPQTLDAATLTWLDARLDETALDCVIVTHAPLLGTVESYFSSFDPFFSEHPDPAIRAILAAHDNARAWISGHTHSPIDSPDLIVFERVGDRGIVAINTTAIAYVGAKPADPATTAGQALCSPFVSVFSDRIEVRFRDHATQDWTTVNGEFVVTVPYDTVIPDQAAYARGAAPIAAFAGSLTDDERADLDAELDWSFANLSFVAAQPPDPYAYATAAGPLIATTRALNGAERRRMAVRSPSLSWPWRIVADRHAIGGVVRSASSHEVGS